MTRSMLPYEQHQTPPNKIYDALFGLEEGVITPENSFIAWNGESYPLKHGIADQTLHLQ